jgi:hypothetical protein
MYLIFGNIKVQPKSNKSRKRLSIIIALIFIGLAFADIYKIRNIVELNSIRQQRHYESAKEMEEMDAEYFLLLPAQSLNFEYSDPLKSNNYNFNMIVNGWAIFSPRFYKTLKELGMEHGYEILPRLASESGGFVIGREDYIARISIFLRETYGLHHRFIRVKQLSNQAIVYKIEKLKAL